MIVVKEEKIVVLFVEGDTEKEFFDNLIIYYRANSSSKIGNTKVFNLKGIGRFERKAASKCKYQILNSYSSENVVVFCCYDSDVFDLAKKPPTNWKLVKKQLKDIQIVQFNEIIAVTMIEDWFLSSLDGLISFLKLKKTPKLKGKNAYEKIKILFKLGNKIYQKGSNSHKFINYLDFSKIRKVRKKELKKLEKELNFTEK